MSHPTAPQPALSWTHSSEDILRITRDAIQQHRHSVDDIVKDTRAECTSESAFLRLAFADTALSCATSPLLKYKSVSPSQELRDASNEADTIVGEYRIEVSMRRDLFDVKQATAANIKNSGKVLELEEQRLVDKMLLDGKRAGLALPDNEFAGLKALQKDLSNTCQEFEKSFVEENGKMSFTLEELVGLPADEINEFTKRMEGGQEVYDIPFDWSTHFVLATYCESSETRKRAHEAFWSRLNTNVPVFEKMLNLRHKVATLLGYDSWADYVTEIRMARNAKNVSDFLSDLEQKLHPLGLQERELLLALKQQEHTVKGFPFDGQYYAWDYNYYHEKYMQSNLDLDAQTIKEYFPVDTVVARILGLYQDLLGVKFLRIEGSTWHPDVQQFAVWENEAKSPSDFIGYCYLDIFSRDGKNGQPYMSPICPGYTKADGTRYYPVVAMISSFTKATHERPALLSHNDVKLFFHEMGHVFHELLSKTRFAQFHGTIGPVDYAEAPSQMLENWCWEPRVLEKLSCHYKTMEPLPQELVGKLLESRHVNVGLSQLRLVFYAIYDLKVHTMQDAGDYTKLWNKLCEEIALEKGEKLVPGQAAFHYMVGEYSAGFYSYAWSNVFAVDMYATVFKADPLDPKRWQKYRESILAPGSSRDENDLLKDFLGRPPNSEAFVKDLLGDRAS